MRTLDLHGMDYEQVVIECHRFLNYNWGKEMKIITGKSNHMKSLVSEIIDKYRLKYHVGGITGMEGYIKVYRG